MDKKGFTLVELLATLVILGIVVGITVVSININMKDTKKKTEEVFIGTLKDAVKIYIDHGAPDVIFDTTEVACEINKALSIDDDGNPIPVNVYRASDKITFSIVNRFQQLDEKKFKNPYNKKSCDMGSGSVMLYRDEDYVYYYEIYKSELGCFEENDYITNLPSTSNCS